MTYLTYLLAAPTRESFDKTIEEILNKLQYQHLRQYTDIMEGITEQINSWIKNWLRVDFQHEEITSTASSISNGVVVIGSILIVLIVIFIILNIKKMVKKDKKVKRILGEIIDEKTTEEELKERARSYKKLGEYREALRYSFIALLFQMHGKNLLHLDETQTNSEIVSMLRRDNFMNIELFEKAVGLFNETWYGHRIVNNDTYKAWEDIIRVLENGVCGCESKKQ